MNMKRTTLTLSLVGAALLATAQELVPAKVRPALPPPAIRPVDLRADEQPVAIDSSEAIVADNGLYRRVHTTFTFTNPNARQMSADLEFPLPEGATVCGYALEVNGVLVPGVVVEKEKARVAFETEKARRVDPGLVEHVAGNVWRTRIFPLDPRTPRRATVDSIVPVADGATEVVCEKDGEDVFVAARNAGTAACVADKIAAFSDGVILWDASGSAAAQAAAWRGKIAALPAEGQWRLVVFRNEPEDLGIVGKAELVAKLEALVYDGGTDIGRALAFVTGLDQSENPVNPVQRTLLFSDELDTLGVERPRYEDVPGVIVASRADVPARAVTVRKLAKGEAVPDGVDVKEGTLLATAWAANRLQDLAAQADARKDEFLALGRRYGVASDVTSLIVLETLEQYLTHKIEPPAALGFHDEWVRRRAAEDDAIAAKKAQAEHEKDLLALWEERVKWWNDPIPPKRTPKSGLFDEAPVGMAAAEEDGENLSFAIREENGVRARRAVALASAPGAQSAMVEGAVVAELAEMAESVEMEAAASAPGAAGSGGATITVAAWNPDAPYLKAIAAAADGYAEYLVQKKTHGAAPAFYMDAAGFFFKKGETALGGRVLSNMAEFGLDDAKVWRAMGWRLREAGLLDAAIRCFRKALKLRGEEGQSRRDLALVLSEYGKANKDAAALAEAMALLKEAAFTDFARRSGRRSNDRQVSIVALEELNALISWCEKSGVAAAAPELEAAYRRDLPVRLRIVLSWDADETDIDLHVLEAEGEEAFYGHRRTDAGGFVGEDVTTGYGPEEYLRKEATGTFKILTNYFASHQTALTGPATVTATVYTDWATAAEKREVLTLRLDKPKEKLPIGDVSL